MAETKKGADAGQAEAQSTYDEAAKQGFFGEKPASAIPNREYTLQSGPDSPTPFEEHVVINERRIADQKASPAEGAK